MKAIEINGQIKQYSILPKSWGNVIGGFNLLSDDELKTYGFYNVVIPNYDARVEEAGNLYFDSVSETFTVDILNKTWTETLNDLKTERLQSLKNYTNNKLSDTDWYVIRKFERNIDIPQDVQDTREEILSNHNACESEINALTTKAEVVSYEFR